MAKPRSGPRGKGRVVKVGGTEVRLIKANKKKPAGTEKTIRRGAVVVPTDNYDPDKVPAVERLRRSVCEIFPDDPDEGGEARRQP